MHPIFGHSRRLLLYLVAWIPIAALLAYLMAVAAGMPWCAALSLSVPLCLLYAFICLSAWYSCRATPLESASKANLLKVHLAAAAVATGFWWLCAQFLARALAETDYFPNLLTHLPRVTPLLICTGILLYLESVSVFYALLAVESSQEAEARVMQVGILAREAELRALKAQVNPHFLFNSLNSISALTASDAPRAREMCVLLGDFLRRTLGLGEKSSIPFSEELSLIHAFLAVEKIRFGSRIQMREDISEDAMAAQIPPLLLQPLVENAVAHGIANLVEGGAIRLMAHFEGSALQIVVENTYDPDAPPRRKSGVGLANVRRRLEARYAGHANFAVTQSDRSFRVEISVPLEREAVNA